MSSEETENVNELTTWDNNKRSVTKHRKQWHSSDTSGRVNTFAYRHKTTSSEASEAWTPKNKDKDKLLAFEMKCCGWILHIASSRRYH